MYHDEERIVPYDGAVEIPKEIQKIRDPIIFNLTKRELCFVSAGLILAAASLWVLFRWIGVRNSAFVLFPVLIATPFLLFAFIRPMGLNLEDWLTIWMSNNIKSAPVRKLFAQNEYEKALELTKAYEEKISADRRGIGWMRKAKMEKSKIQKMEKGKRTVKMKKAKSKKSAYKVRM